MKLEDFDIDFNEWPGAWEGIEEDVEPGERIVKEVFIPYFQFLVESGLTKKTVKRHISNIWLLGGEIIRGLYFEEDGFRDSPALELVLHSVDCGEAPTLPRYHSEDRQRTFDSSCKKLYKFLINIELK